MNRLTNMLDGVGATRYTYTAAGMLATEDGPWESDTVSLTYTNRLRSALSLQQPNASAWAHTYGYDAARRLTTLTSPAGEFSYDYTGGGSLVQRLVLPSSAYVTNSFDPLARLTGTYLKNSGHTNLSLHEHDILSTLSDIPCA